MGRKKLEIKRIESQSSRQVTFTKRRNGIMKKAKELSILCDVDVGVIIYSARGKLYNFTSSNNSLTEIIHRYHSCVEREANESAAICATEQDHSKIGTFLTVKELLDGVERHLDYPNQLSRDNFVYLEDQLQGALLETRARKMHLMTAAVMNLEEKDGSILGQNLNSEEAVVVMRHSSEFKSSILYEKMLLEENRLLAEKIAMDGEKMDEGNTEIDLNETPRTPKFL